MKGKYMNVSPVKNSQVNPNFGAMKSLKFCYCLRESKSAQEKVLKEIKANSALQKFCKNFDVDIFVGADLDVLVMDVGYRNLSDKPKTLFGKTLKWLKENLVEQFDSIIRTKHLIIKSERLAPPIYGKEFEWLEKSAVSLGKNIQKSENVFNDIKSFNESDPFFKIIK
jgi:hypothetical protein